MSLMFPSELSVIMYFNMNLKRFQLGSLSYDMHSYDTVTTHLCTLSPYLEQVGLLWHVVILHVHVNMFHGCFYEHEPV